MKKSYKIENLCCPNCALKMEEAISKLDGVERASINFILQKLTLEADGERMAELVREADACCRRIERDCRVVY